MRTLFTYLPSSEIHVELYKNKNKIKNSYKSVDQWKYINDTLTLYEKEKKIGLSNEYAILFININN